MRGRSRPEPPPTAAAPWAERPPSALELEQRFQLLTGMSSRFYALKREREQDPEYNMRQGRGLLEKELLEKVRAKARARAMAERETGKGKTSKGKDRWKDDYAGKGKGKTSKGETGKDMTSEGETSEGETSKGKRKIGGGKAVRPAKAKAQAQQRRPVPRGSVAACCSNPQAGNEGDESKEGMKVI